MRSLFLSLMAASVVCLVVVASPSRAQAQYNGTYSQAQNWRGSLSPDDQKDFDKYYSKWVDASRKGDRDDIAENARHMQDIMVRNRIPVGVSFDQIATNPEPGYNGAYPNNGYPNSAYPNGSYGNNGYPNGAYPYPAGQARLSPDDQRKFDKDYQQWMDAQRKGDRDDVDKHARDMEGMMSRYNIPANVPFASIATNGYPAGTYANAPNGYAYGAGSQRLSDKDQKDFDKAYHHWVEARNKRDMDDVDKNERKMREIMSKYNIPANVSFDQIATAGSAYR